MNALFDTLNTAKLYSRNPNKQVISDSTEALKTLKNARSWISTWRSTSEVQIPPCFKGLRQTLLAIVQMWEYLKSEEQSYFLLAHLNTDAAENLFSIVRSNRGSYERNPSAWRFIRNLKQVIFHHFSSAEHSGYQDTGAESLLQQTDYEVEMKSADDNDFQIEESIEDNILENKMEYNLEENPFDDDEQMEVDINEKDSFSEKLQKAAAAYYAGFAASKIKNKLNCEVCSQFMIVEDCIMSKERQQTLLIKLRAYESITTASEFGKLSVPSILFERSVRIVQATFEADFMERQQRENLVDKWLPEIMKKSSPIMNMNCTAEHKEVMTRFLLIGLIILSLRKINKDIKLPKRRQ